MTDPAALAAKAHTLLEAPGEPAIVVRMEVAQEPVLAGHISRALAKLVHDKWSAGHSLPWRQPASRPLCTPPGGLQMLKARRVMSLWRPHGLHGLYQGCQMHFAQHSLPAAAPANTEHHQE